MRFQFNWIHGTFHWAEEDSWRYFYHSSRPNEQVSFSIEWLAQQHEAAPRRTPTVVATKEAVEPSIPVWDKGKRMIFDRMEEKQSCKF